VQLYEHRRIAIEVRGREIHLGVVGQQCLLGPEVCDPGSQDWPGRRRAAERTKIGGAKRPLPHEQPVAHPPRGQTTRGPLAGLG
jgi:hypothetical protein